MTNQTIQLAISITGSQKRLADLCGVAQPTVWRWLHGGGIDARYVMKIVSATVSADFFSSFIKANCSGVGEGRSTMTG